MLITRTRKIRLGIGYWIGFVFLSTGCAHTHTTYLSDHWIAQPQGLYHASINHHRPTLQVIITYDGFLSSHAALRLVAERGKVTFWDPAGAYGLHPLNSDEEGNPTKVNRVNDLILGHIPDIGEYVRFRWHVGDLTVEVLEWDLPPEVAGRLEGVLLNGQSDSNESDTFRTDTAPAFCTVAISDFLQRFARPVISLPNWYLWPHNLAEALLDQTPARIRIFHNQGRELVYIPPYRSAGQSSFIGAPHR